MIAVVVVIVVGLVGTPSPELLIPNVPKLRACVIRIRSQTMEPRSTPLL
jgi:hypothetical protein